MTNIAWVVVANGSKAHVYQWSSLDQPMAELQCLLNPDERLQSRELGTGPTSQGITGRAALAPRQYPKEHLRDEFARRLAHDLDDGRRHDRFHELVVVASNPFLGELLAQLTPETREMLVVSYPIDVTALPRLELENWLRRRRKPGFAQ